MVMPSVAEVKLVLADNIIKLEKSIGRKNTYLQELEDDRKTLEAVIYDRDNGVSFPLNSAYSSYAAWIDQLQKEVTAGENSILRIEREKAELVAAKYYIENAAETPKP
ncbi:hypothetical protein SAMN02745174_00973 [Cetobacterium ceti]|uniref:Uncharacterized protein n=1 Tax=Cetobacterium ceti TaxID=180163 RepID=A0A1T4LV05_9FUSO|nr:hypothetical protein [Cetobacterium ceti]SJZ58328.1 hypothetical protein SAMN02745174_00973 [Cetobacterium ceti]